MHINTDFKHLAKCNIGRQKNVMWSMCTITLLIHTVSRVGYVYDNFWVQVQHVQ